MKVGLITIHKTINFGAVFQAYGLYYFLDNLANGHCEVINYRMNSRKGEENNKTCSQSKLHIRIKQLLHLKETLDYRKTRALFEDFCNTKMCISNYVIYGDREATPEDFRYDICVSGSDQIFNLDLTNESKAFYLEYADNAKKIAYSSSFGMHGLIKEREEEVSKILSSYDAISIREKTAAEKLTQLMGRPIIATCDPVFLIKKEEWIRISNPIKLPKRYILAYIMSNNHNIKATVDWIKKNEELPVIIVKNGNYDLDIQGRIIKNIGPKEFLHYINNAEYVVTNSFHGTALSIIFGKNFFCLEEKKYVGDQRYSKLAFEGDFIEKITPYDTDWSCFDFSSHLLNGDRIYHNIEPWIQESKQFLYDNIKI